MDDQLDPEREADARATTRTNMYIAAVLSSGECSSPAKIRNMSASGALVETPAVPAVGSTVRLVRGALGVEGTVAWAVNGRCGIRFKSLVSAGEWMSPAPNKEQNRVDQTVALLRAGALPMSGARQRQDRTSSQVPMAEQLAAELREVIRLLDQIGNELTDDEHVVQKYGRQLQSLDLVEQSIGLAVAVLLERIEGEAELGLRLQSLRASRLQSTSDFELKSRGSVQ